jgi:putative flippase GtrA
MPLTAVKPPNRLIRPRARTSTSPSDTVAPYLGGLTFSEPFTQAARVVTDEPGSLGFVIRDFYSRFRVLIHEVTKFGIVGILAFVITLVGANLLHSDAKMGATAATAVATVVATIFAFIGNRNWAFKHRQGHGLGREGLLFLIFNGVGLLIQTGAVYIDEHVMHHTGKLSFNVALVIGVAAATLFRLYCYHRWVFNAAPSEPPAAEQLEPEATGR